MTDIMTDMMTDIMTDIMTGEIQKERTKGKIQKEKVLFICKNNSGRSQMAEGLLQHLYGEYYTAYSAGTDPKDVNPLTIRLMDEIGIDISGSESKSLDKFQGMEFDYVMTLCEKESCPVFPDAKKYIHHDFKDPAGFQNRNDKVELFREIRDEISAWIEKEFKTKD
jgi:arsenate reductase